MAKQARTTKTQNTPATAGAAGAGAASAVVAVPAGNAAVALYTLGTKAPRSVNTKQGAKSGAGHAWASAPTATVAPNTRANAYAALQGLGATFTQAAALAALAPVVQGTSGSARSYWAAFVAAGYVVGV